MLAGLYVCGQGWERLKGLIPSTDNEYVDAVGPSLPHASACACGSVCVCAHLCRAWGTAWGLELSLGPKGAGGPLGPPAPHTEPQQGLCIGPVALADPCHWGGCVLVQVAGAQVQECRASSSPGRTTAALCPG